jgi:hypothetical protein
MIVMLLMQLQLRMLVMPNKRQMKQSIVMMKKKQHEKPSRKLMLINMMLNYNESANN